MVDFLTIVLVWVFPVVVVVLLVWRVVRFRSGD